MRSVLACRDCLQTRPQPPLHPASVSARRVHTLHNPQWQATAWVLPLHNPNCGCTLYSWSWPSATSPRIKQGSQDPTQGPLRSSLAHHASQPRSPVAATRSSRAAGRGQRRPRGPILGSQKPSPRGPWPGLGVALGVLDTRLLPPQARWGTFLEVGRASGRVNWGGGSFAVGRS